MFEFKVEYISTAPEKGKWYKSKNKVDSWTLAKELEALLNEYWHKGYDLVETRAIVSNRGAADYTTVTDGILVIFQKKR